MLWAVSYHEVDEKRIELERWYRVLQWGKGIFSYKSFSQINIFFWLMIKFHICCSIGAFIIIWKTFQILHWEYWSRKISHSYCSHSYLLQQVAWGEGRGQRVVLMALTLMYKISKNLNWTERQKMGLVLTHPQTSFVTLNKTPYLSIQLQCFINLWFCFSITFIMVSQSTHLLSWESSK